MPNDKCRMANDKKRGAESSSTFDIRHLTFGFRPYAALLVAIGGISWSAILVRWAGVPGTASAFYRVLIAGAVLVPWRLVRGSTRPVSSRAAAVAVLGGVFFALDIALWNTSVMHTGAAVASILGNNTPVFVGILTWLVLLRLPLAGYPPRAWFAMAGLGLVSQLAAYYALVYALGHLPATITSVGLLAQVPCTALLAWLLLGEPLTPFQLAGGAVVLAGIYVVNRPAMSEQ